MNNYNDIRNQYKNNTTDIFNTNSSIVQKPIVPGKQVFSQANRSDIFQQQNQSQQQNIVKPSPQKSHYNKSTIFTSEAKEYQPNHRRPNSRGDIQNSDIFLRESNNQQLAQFKPNRKQVSNIPKDNGESRDFNRSGKKIQTEKKQQDHNDIITDGKDMSYMVKKDKTKNYEVEKQKVDQLRNSYKIENERFQYLKSQQGDKQNQDRYNGYKQSDVQKQSNQEKASYNSQWWSNVSSKSKVNEQAVFDKNYARNRQAQGQQSSIFSESQVIPSSNTNNQKVLQEKNDNNQEATQSQETNKVKHQSNLSNLSGYEQPQKSNNPVKKQQSGLIPSSLGNFSHDSNLHKISDPLQQEKSQQQQGTANEQYQKSMQSCLDTHENQIQNQNTNKQEIPQKFENFQVVDNLEENQSIIIPDNQSQTEEQKKQAQIQQSKVQQVSDYNYQQIQKKKQLAQDPQRIEQWEQDPYKERVSLLSQKKQETQEVKVIEMSLKGLNDKFDINNFKKICARKGYHLVDFDMKYNFNKPTGQGKLILRNSRKVADGPDTVKAHLKSLGVNVMREQESSATMVNNKVQLETDKQKKKLFSDIPPNLRPQTATTENNSTVKSQNKQDQKQKITDVTSRLYSAKPQVKRAEKKEEIQEKPVIKKVIKKKAEATTKQPEQKPESQQQQQEQKSIPKIIKKKVPATQEEQTPQPQAVKKDSEVL